MWTEDRLEVVSDGRRIFSLARWPWLDDEQRIVGLLDPSADADTPAERSFGRWKLVRDADRYSLELPWAYTAGQTYRLVVRRPLHTRIKRRGAWAESTVGLVDDADEFAWRLNDVKVVALHYAYKALSLHGAESTRTMWELKAARQADTASWVKNWNLPEDDGSDRPLFTRRAWHARDSMSGSRMWP